jgi:hypothetical protein
MGIDEYNTHSLKFEKTYSIWISNHACHDHLLMIITKFYHSTMG